MTTLVKALAVAALPGVVALSLSSTPILGKASPTVASEAVASPTPTANASTRLSQADVVEHPMQDRPQVRHLEADPSPTPSGLHAEQTVTGPVLCDADAGIRFDASLLDRDGISVIRATNDTDSSRVTPSNQIRIFNKDPWSDPHPFVVRSPAAGQIIEIARSPYDQSSPDGSVTRRDYRIVIAHSCMQFSVFIHVAELAPDIAKVTSDLPLNGRWTPRSAEGIPVEAGQVIAGFRPYLIDNTLVDAWGTLTGFVVP